MRFSVFGNYINFLLNEYHHMHLVSFKITYWIGTMLQSNGLHIVLIPEMCTCWVPCFVTYLRIHTFSPLPWAVENSHQYADECQFYFRAYKNYVFVLFPLSSSFCLIISCLYQYVFKGKFLWYCGNTDEKLHNISKVKSTKILSGDSWAPFSIVLNWVLTFYSNELQDLTNIGDQLKKHSHLPNS